MLYRAFVSPSFTLDDQPQREMLVFFECSRSDLPSERLRQVVAHAWNTKPEVIEHYNLTSESEQRAMWAPAPGQQPLPGHTVQLQTGDGMNGPTFADPHRTQLLVGPIWHDRLVQAQRSAIAVQMAQLAGALATYHRAQPLDEPAAAPAPAAGRAPVSIDDMACRRATRNAAMGL